jgi:hypothetical protein
MWCAATQDARRESAYRRLRWLMTTAGGCCIAVTEAVIWLLSGDLH